MQNAKFQISKSKAIEQFNKVKPLADLVSYSSKTNQTVTKILEENTQSLFSVHFVNELKHLRDMSRVIFLAQGWTESDIMSLVSQGITRFTVDNGQDLETLLKFLETQEKKISLFLRLKLKEHTVKTERYFVFGMSSETINKKIPELKKNPKIQKLGIHFHRKTQNISEWDLKYELSNILTPETLDAIDYMNIGGGLPSQYANTRIDVLESVIEKIKDLKTWLNSLGIKMIIEPGRFIAAPTGKLITKIVAIHDNNIIVNASVYNSDLDAIIVPVKLLVEGELPQGQGTPFVIKGITPCSMDLFRYRVYLNQPKVGDEIIFLNAGAYNFTSDFCDLEPLETEVVE